MVMRIPTMTVTWDAPDVKEGVSVEKGVTAPLDIWLGQVLWALSKDQRRVVIDNVREMTEEENERRKAQELEAAESEFDAEHG